MRIPCFAAALLAASIAQAQNPDALAEGLKLFADLEYEAAMPHLTAAKTDETLRNLDRATAALHLAVIQLSLGDEESGRRNIKEALALDRDARLPTDASPKVREMVEAERATLPPRAPVQVIERPPAAVTQAEPAFYERWWFWTAVGVVAATSIAVYAVTRSSDGDNNKNPVDPCNAPGGQGCLNVVVTAW